VRARDGEIHMLLRYFDKAFTASEEKHRPGDFVVTEISMNEVVFVDSQKPNGGFLRYDASKKDTLEFFDHESDEIVIFSLLFKKVRTSY
jgi:hypothetical protein